MLDKSQVPKIKKVEKGEMLARQMEIEKERGMTVMKQKGERERRRWSEPEPGRAAK